MDRPFGRPSEPERGRHARGENLVAGLRDLGLLVEGFRVAKRLLE